MVCHANEETHKNLWYLDTSCINHKFRDKSVFSYLNESYRDIVKFRDNFQVSMIGKGKVTIQTKENLVHYITIVLFVSKLKTNLLGVGQLPKKGYVIFIKNGVCKIKDEKLGLIAQELVVNVSS
ncbi:hypothetical protein QQP08_016927 [Theobroma cacao]|nr:hypothetical protein QQP08_016927 [Theobroma cacao]